MVKEPQPVNWFLYFNIVQKLNFCVVVSCRHREITIVVV